MTILLPAIERLRLARGFAAPLVAHDVRAMPSTL
jgi:hypothetical protein